MAIGLEIKY